MAVNKCLKYLLFSFNLLFWLSGCINLGMSIYHLKVSEDENKITDPDMDMPAIYLMIGIGVIIMLLGFLGCCGAIKENRCMLLLFFISLLLIFILLLATGILGAVSLSTVKDEVMDRLEKFTPLSSQPQKVRDDVEMVQRELKCCGIVKGPSDWTKIPDSCRCNSTDPDCKSGAVFTESCHDKIISQEEQDMKGALGIIFAFAVLMIFGMVFSMILYCQIGKKISGATTTNA